MFPVLLAIKSSKVLSLCSYFFQVAVVRIYYLELLLFLSDVALHGRQQFVRVLGRMVGYAILASYGMIRIRNGVSNVGIYVRAGCSV